MSDNFWVNPEGLKQTGQPYQESAAYFERLHAEIQSIIQRYGGCWGNDDMGQRIGPTFINGLDSIAETVAAVGQQLRYGGDGLVQTGGEFQKSEEYAEETAAMLRRSVPGERVPAEKRLRLLPLEPTGSSPREQRVRFADGTVPLEPTRSIPRVGKRGALRMPPVDETGRLQADGTVPLEPTRSFPTVGKRGALRMLPVDETGRLQVDETGRPLVVPADDPIASGSGEHGNGEDRVPLKYNPHGVWGPDGTIVPGRGYAEYGHGELDGVDPVPSGSGEHGNGEDRVPLKYNPHGVWGPDGTIVPGSGYAEYGHGELDRVDPVPSGSVVDPVPSGSGEHGSAQHGNGEDRVPLRYNPHGTWTSDGVHISGTDFNTQLHERAETVPAPVFVDGVPLDDDYFVMTAGEVEEGKVRLDLNRYDYVAPIGNTGIVALGGEGITANSNEQLFIVKPHDGPPPADTLYRDFARDGSSTPLHAPRALPEQRA